MSPKDLKELIESDEQAQKLATLGAADLCAARCREIAPKTFQSKTVTELTIIGAYKNPVDAEQILQQIEDAAINSPLVKRVLKWLQPGAPGVDIGDERTRQVMLTPVEMGGCGLTLEQVNPIFDLALVEASITGIDITNALENK